MPETRRASAGSRLAAQFERVSDGSPSARRALTGALRGLDPDTSFAVLGRLHDVGIRGPYVTIADIQGRLGPTAKSIAETLRR